MPNLNEVIFSITNRCNLGCRMCDIPCAKTEELSTEQWKKVINDASALGAQTIVFSGGEPLLREDIFELISFTKKNNLSACVTSNGCLINEPVAIRLSESGVNVMNISIEGPRETHDFLRGKGNFDKAIAALDWLRKCKIESTIASTVSRHNYAELVYILEIARNYGATTVRLQPFNVIFLKDDTRKNEFLIARRDIQKVEDVVKGFIDKAKEYKISINPESYLFKIPEYLAGKKFYPDNCAALWYSCPINPNGDVFPCWIEGSNKKLIGNVREEGLYKLWVSEKRTEMVNSIVKNGCTGCLMSCYDEVFGRKPLKEFLFDRAKKIRKITDYKRVANKAVQSLRGQITQLKLRYRFYSSYSGPLSVILKRRLSGAFSRRRQLKGDSRKEQADILSEIGILKNKLKKEINSL